MHSWSPSNYPGDEQSPNWSSTATSTSNQPSPGRREHVVQPPLLTTALSGPQFQRRIGLAGPASTPLSSTSLSSPFTQGQSPSGPSPGNPRSEPSSVMAARHSGVYNVPYNPQDWGPVGGASAQVPYPQSNNMLRIVPQQQRTHSAMSLSPPPPPYSPPSNQRQPSGDAFRHSAIFSATSPAVSPPQAPSKGGEFELPAQFQRRSMHRARPLSMIHIDGGTHPQSLPPPPPPQGHSSSRSISQSGIDGYSRSNTSAEHSAALRVDASTSHGEHNLSSLPSIGHVPSSSVGQLNLPMRAPASRRAASAGAVVDNAGSSRSMSQSRSRSPSGSHWEPGMPLPPPPRGPPPATRSLSVSGSSESSMRTPHALGRPRVRASRVFGSGLGSIPPTPGDWVDEEYINSHSSRDKGPLHIDTAQAIVSSDRTENPDLNELPYQRTPESGGLFRSPAIRESSAKGIRERRIERRNRKSLSLEPDSAVSASGNPWADALEEIRPSNLILAMRDSPDHNRHPSPSKFTPRSTHSLGSDGQITASRSRASSSTGLFSDQSSYSTPRPDPSPARPSVAFAPTPPFSANVETSQLYTKNPSQAVPPKALPTPPPNSAQDPRPRSRATSRGAEDRPISHLLHLPNDTVSMIAPLSPRRPVVRRTSQQANSLKVPAKRDAEFVQDAIIRNNAFIEKEASAADETEALKIFTEFIIAESRIRRERYAKVWTDNSLDLENMHKKLFEMPGQAEPGAQRSSYSSEPVSPLEMPSNRPSRPESGWWNSYQPCLSPIASLSISNDEKSSRGRAPSRWWESNTGSSSQGAERKVQRSKRESKYMGLPRDSMLWDQERTPSKADDAGSNYTGQQHAAYGQDEYPPEKVGWHEEASAAHPGSVEVGGYSRHSAESQKLDISRLITLPPPYPRHHPAVNNSHPDLVTYRTTVRSITDLSEIKSTRQRYKIDVERMLQEHQSQVQEGHRQFKSNIQSQIQEGSLTFAEAAEAEAAMIVEDSKRERELVKRELDTYQETVLTPMHTILMDRINRATACIDELSSMLFDDANHGTPDQAQEEGDEKPELLEKLTQLKWLFEAREQLHREVFDLISDRDEKYKAVALLPYTQSKNEGKIRETQVFFAQDALDRKVQYETAALERFESFLNIIEQNVVRGVEVQLSAFWDIAPSLLALIQQVPEHLGGFQVQIPTDEYEENPTYRTHPLQYLYTLLSHAERSSYQYIESQTNLLCLLHEVRSAVMRANRNLMEAERIRKGEAEEIVRREVQSTRANEELSLTSDLKDKVGTVEGQWAEALGSQFQGLREHVKEQLVAEDGWEDLERLEHE